MVDVSFIFDFTYIFVSIIQCVVNVRNYRYSFTFAQENSWNEDINHCYTPNLNTSKVNKRFAGELEKYSDKYEIHKLYELYPTKIINVEEEQKLIEKFDKIVFQFSVYWYNCPPLLKKWFDEVLVYGWAYGSDYKLIGKKDWLMPINQWKWRGLSAKRKTQIYTSWID